MARPDTYKTFRETLDTALASKGKIALPGVKEIEDPAEALKAITYARETISGPCHFRLRDFNPPRNGVQTHELVYYPKVFLNHKGMGSAFDGSGVILAGGKAYSFAMCEHVWNEAGANHMRGWHPAICDKCGFDASIDSGD